MAARFSDQIDRSFFLCATAMFNRHGETHVGRDKHRRKRKHTEHRGARRTWRRCVAARLHTSIDALLPPCASLRSRCQKDASSNSLPELLCSPPDSLENLFSLSLQMPSKMSSMSDAPRLLQNARHGCFHCVSLKSASTVSLKWRPWALAFTALFFYQSRQFG